MTKMQKPKLLTFEEHAVLAAQDLLSHIAHLDAMLAVMEKASKGPKVTRPPADLMRRSKALRELARHMLALTESMRS